VQNNVIVAPLSLVPERKVLKKINRKFWQTTAMTTQTTSTKSRIVCLINTQQWHTQLPQGQSTTIINYNRWAKSVMQTFRPLLP
jgi:hypothetical protein